MVPKSALAICLPVLAQLRGLDRERDLGLLFGSIGTNELNPLLLGVELALGTLVLQIGVGVRVSSGRSVVVLRTGRRLPQKSAVDGCRPTHARWAGRVVLWDGAATVLGRRDRSGLRRHVNRISAALVQSLPGSSYSVPLYSQQGLR